jgi:hypothetical protein
VYSECIRHINLLVCLVAFIIMVILIMMMYDILLLQIMTWLPLRLWYRLLLYIKHILLSQGNSGVDCLPQTMLCNGCRNQLALVSGTGDYRVFAMI